MSRILITGASGFIGRALVVELASAGHAVRAAMREPSDVFPRSVEVIAVSDLTRRVEWRPLLENIDTVIHLAGIAHTSKDTPEQSYDRVNRAATEELANAVKRAKIGRLIFSSSIRAQSGPASEDILRETDAPRPTDAYGRSKLAAEQAIRASGVSFTILRPVVVYGPGVRGNVARLIKLAREPWPLPLGLCRNKRSLLARENLIEAILFSLKSQAAKDETFIVADRTPLSLRQIIAALRAGEGRNPRLLPVPTTLLALGARALGKMDEWERLAGNQIADPGKLMRAGWTPKIDTDAGLKAMASEEIT